MILYIKNLNTNLIQKPYRIPKISTIMQELEGFRYATVLELNIGYYTIHLDYISQDICTIMICWGNYKYDRPPIGIMSAPDISKKICHIMEGIESARIYLDYFLSLSKDHSNEHLEGEEIILKILWNVNLRINAMNPSFGKTKINNVRYVVTRKVINPRQKEKIEAMLNILH